MYSQNKCYSLTHRQDSHQSFIFWSLMWLSSVIWHGNVTKSNLQRLEAQLLGTIKSHAPSHNEESLDTGSFIQWLKMGRKHKLLYMVRSCQYVYDTNILFDILTNEPLVSCYIEAFTISVANFNSTLRSGEKKIYSIMMLCSLTNTLSVW